MHLDALFTVLRSRLSLVAAAGLVAGCATVKVEPIHITVDINIKVDRALDDFFSAVPNPGTPPGKANELSLTPATTSP